MEREVSKEQQTRHIHDDTLMRFRIRPSPKPGTISRWKLAFHLRLQEFSGQTNHPRAGRCRYVLRARSTGARACATRSSSAEPTSHPEQLAAAPALGHRVVCVSGLTRLIVTNSAPFIRPQVTRESWTSGRLTGSWEVGTGILSRV
jgi:hypothetical protein